MNITEELCLERDCHRCRHCSSTESISAFVLSHVHIAAKPKLSNLITLCDLCKAESVKASKISNNKVGVILCGGKGSRLYPITKFINKHHLPIGILPTIFYPIKTMRSLGVRKVLLVVDRENSGTIEMIGSGKEFGLDISYKVQEGAAGIADAMYLSKDFARPGDEIVCILGDNIFDNKDFNNTISLCENMKACVWLKKVDNPKAYGVASIKDNKVVEIIEKPDSPASNLAVVGLYMYTYDVFNVIESIKPSDRGELEISDVNDFYAKNGLLAYDILSGYWGDSGGSIQRYAECSMHGAKAANVSSEEIDNFRSIVFDDK